LDSLPDTAGDIRGAMATAIKNNSIKTPFVRNQYEHFYRNCYSPASGKFQYLVKKGDIIKDEWFFKLWNNDIDIEEYDWVGGSFYLIMSSASSLSKPLSSLNSLMRFFLNPPLVPQSHLQLTSSTPLNFVVTPLGIKDEL
jgi:hypothetical protein